jgi:hypothetical protein
MPYIVHGIPEWTLNKMVGPTGFEPATSTTPRWRATRLRHGPTYSGITWELNSVPEFKTEAVTKIGVFDETVFIVNKSH